MPEMPPERRSGTLTGELRGVLHPLARPDGPLRSNLAHPPPTCPPPLPLAGRGLDQGQDQRQAGEQPWIQHPQPVQLDSRPTLGVAGHRQRLSHPPPPRCRSRRGPLPGVAQRHSRPVAHQPVQPRRIFVQVPHRHPGWAQVGRPRGQQRFIFGLAAGDRVGDQRPVEPW